MRRAILLHGIQDARRLLGRGRPDADLLCTHPGVELFLQEHPGWDCPCLSRFLPPSCEGSLFAAVSAAVDPILDELDAAVAPELNGRHGLKMRYFKPLYSYFGKIQLLAYLGFRESLRRFREASGAEVLEACDRGFDSFLATDTRMSALAPLLPEGLRLEVCPEPPAVRPGWLGARLDALTRPHLLPRLWRRLAADVRRRVRPLPSRGRPGLLLCEPLYELGFLRSRLKGAPVLEYPAGSDFPAGFRADRQRPEAPARWPARLASASGDPLTELFAHDLRRDFEAVMGKGLAAVLRLRDILAGHPIRAAVWGLPPNSGARALLFEFLRSEGIPVVGAQHGCAYGEMSYPWHFDSDFSRCDTYLSYGFGGEDLRRLYPRLSTPARIVPVGKAAHPSPSPRARRIDILFPVTNGLSIFDDGLTRTYPHVLAAYQQAILDFLESREGLRVCVKPFPNAGPGNCAVWERLARLRKSEVVYGVGLMEFLKSHAPRIVVLELPSQPLVEVIGLDTEIFLLGDQVNRYDPQALDLLRRRVHYYEDSASLLTGLDAFLRGALAPKRDQSYQRRYVSRDRTQEDILGVLDGIA